ncbi:MAG TPA: aldo/keto reductase [Abditibacteriaceae bacterium]|jgi:aryl-alcohol dehydrogenase-like predicted oxidoreductase
MQQRQLGPNGPTVGAIGIGTGPLCIPDNRPSVQDAVQVLTHAATLGMTLWDTADAYCKDEADMGYGDYLCQKAFAALPGELRERVIVATKGGTVRPDNRWDRDSSPEYLKSAIDASLLALQTDCIDLWQLHSPDGKTPFADSIGAIAEAKQQGKIRLVGLSNVTAAQIEEAAAIVPLASIQNHFSFHSRNPEEDGVLDRCRELGLAFLPYSPLGGMNDAKDLGRTGVLAEVAKELNATPQQTVLAWLLHKYDKMIPIPGMSRTGSLEDSAKASEIMLTDEQFEQLNAANDSKNK